MILSSFPILAMWHGHQDQVASVMKAANDNIPRALAIAALLEQPDLRLNAELAARMLEVPGLLQACLETSTSADDRRLAQWKLNGFLRVFAHRPAYNGQQWLSRSHEPKHLRHQVDHDGTEHMLIHVQGLKLRAQEAWTTLRRQVTQPVAQALVNAYFFGHAGQPDGYLGIVAAWRDHKKERPLSFDTLALLARVIFNVSKKDVVAHDFQHLVGMLYTTSAGGETVGANAGAGNRYEDAAMLDAIDPNQDLFSQPGFVKMLFKRAIGFLSISEQKPSALLLVSTFQTAVARVFDERKAQLQVGISDSTKTDFVQAVLNHVQANGGLTHLNAAERQEVEKWLFDAAQPQSMRAVLDRIRPSYSPQGVVNQFAPALTTLDQLSQRATVRLLPPDDEERWEFVARILALDLLLVQHGFKHQQYPLSGFGESERWGHLRGEYRALNQVDVAKDYPAMYARVKAAIAQMRSAPRWGLNYGAALSQP